MRCALSMFMDLRCGVSVNGSRRAAIGPIGTALFLALVVIAVAVPEHVNAADTLAVGVHETCEVDLPGPVTADDVDDDQQEETVSRDMTIELLPSACSEGSQILLGEIARVHVEDDVLRAALESVEVGSAPLPGASRKVGLGQVQVRMRARKIDPGDFVFEGPTEVMVVAAAKRVAASDIERTAIEAVCASTEHALSPLDFRVARTDAPQGLLVPPGEVSLTARVAQPGADMSFVRVRVQATVDGLEARSVLVWLEITAPSAVSQLAAVTLVVEAGDVQVSVPAVALQDGRPGQRIRVRNAVTGVVVQARVLDSRTVRAHVGNMEGSP